MVAKTEKPVLAQSQDGLILDEVNVDAIVGDNIRQLRVRLNKTQADIAQVLGISAQQYQKYEKGSTKCSIASLLKLAEFYECDISKLLPNTKRTGDGFNEDVSRFSTPTQAIEEDETAAVSAILAILIRIPEKSARRRVLETLAKIV